MDFTFRVKKVVFPHEIFARMRKRFFPLQKTAEERERGKRRKRGKREKSTTTHIILVNSYSFLAKWEKIPTLRIWYLSKMGAKEKEAKRRDNFTENGYVPLDYFMGAVYDFGSAWLVFLRLVIASLHLDVRAKGLLIYLHYNDPSLMTSSFS